MREVKQNDVKAYMTPNSVSKTYLISTSEEAIKMQLTCDQFIYFASSKRQNCDWDLTQKKKKRKKERSLQSGIKVRQAMGRKRIGKESCSL